MLQSNVQVAEGLLANDDLARMFGPGAGEDKVDLGFLLEALVIGQKAATGTPPTLAG